MKEAERVVRPAEKEFLENVSGSSVSIPSVINAPFFACSSYLSDSYLCALFFGCQKSTLR